MEQEFASLGVRRGRRWRRAPRALGLGRKTARSPSAKDDCDHTSGDELDAFLREGF